MLHQSKYRAARSLSSKTNERINCKHIQRSTVDQRNPNPPVPYRAVARARALPRAARPPLAGEQTGRGARGGRGRGGRERLRKGKMGEEWIVIHISIFIFVNICERVLGEYLGKIAKKRRRKRRRQRGCVTVTVLQLCSRSPPPSLPAPEAMSLAAASSNCGASECSAAVMSPSLARNLRAIHNN